MSHFQSHCRKFLARVWYLRLKKAVISTQCAWRCKVAHKELRKLKMVMIFPFVRSLAFIFAVLTSMVLLFRKNSFLVVCLLPHNFDVFWVFWPIFYLLSSSFFTRYIFFKWMSFLTCYISIYGNYDPLPTKKN